MLDLVVADTFGPFKVWIRRFCEAMGTKSWLGMRGILTRGLPSLAYCSV
jgi:hypothetical protein